MAAGNNNNNGDEVAVVLYWGGEMVKWGDLGGGSLDYSHRPMAMCFLSRGSRRRLRDLSSKVQAAMKDGKNDGTGVSLFGRYPTTLPGGKVVWVAIPLTDYGSYRWFLDEAALLSKPLHVYVVPSDEKRIIIDDNREKKKKKRKKKEEHICFNGQCASLGKRKRRGLAIAMKRKRKIEITLNKTKT
ncbi:unnamed protein product [Cuscuta campestris]|uniref:Uncharacterized protein n=1 Tax=Cuscuta campestris TaxID=132261 RepID=A0A484MBY8_9ASTE|nr:unnamed protein product [Cuscuta campestris]